MPSGTPEPADRQTDRQVHRQGDGAKQVAGQLVHRGERAPSNSGGDPAGEQRFIEEVTHELRSKGGDRTGVQADGATEAEAGGHEREPGVWGLFSCCWT